MTSSSSLTERFDVLIVGGGGAGLEAEGRIVHTEGGEALPYDALLLAPGARMHARFKHVTTIDDKRLDELLHGLIQDVEGGLRAPPRIHRPRAGGMATADLRAGADEGQQSLRHEH